MTEPGPAVEPGGVLGFLKSWWFILVAVGLWLLAVNRAIERIDGLQASIASLQHEQVEDRERLARLETSVSSLSSRFDRLVGYLAGGAAFAPRAHDGPYPNH